MERANGWIAQLYGYAVCLICIVIILVSTHTIIDSAFDYVRPVNFARMNPYPTQYDAGRGPASRGSVSAGTATMSDSGMRDTAERRFFRESRQMEMDDARYRALRSLVSSVVFLILASGMFLLHWRWIRRSTSEAIVN